MAPNRALGEARVSRPKELTVNPRRTGPALSVLALCLAMAGCGSDSSSSSKASSGESSSSSAGSSQGAGGYGSSGSSSSSSASGSASGFKVEGTPVTLKGTKTVSGESSVELDDDYFKPTVIKGKPGATVKLELENEGAAEHNFTLESQHVNKDVEAGHKAVVQVKIPTKGRLTFYCEYHVKRGMCGALQPAG